MGRNDPRPAGLNIERRDMSWQDEAPCAEFYAETGIDLWFGPDRSDLKYTDPDDVTNVTKMFQRRAKIICRHCPVQKECLTFAFATEGDEFRSGVWGGMGSYERTQLKNRVLAEREGKVA